MVWWNSNEEFPWTFSSAKSDFLIKVSIETEAIDIIEETFFLLKFQIKKTVELRIVEFSLAATFHTNELSFPKLISLIELLFGLQLKQSKVGSIMEKSHNFHLAW